MARSKKSSGKKPGKRSALVDALKRFGFRKPDASGITDSLSTALPGRGKGKKGKKDKKKRKKGGKKGKR